jgi:hypothetical protein
MKTLQTLGFISIVTSVLLFSGCGSSSSDAVALPTTTDTATAEVITVERGPILGATVVDANNSVAVDIGSGQYVFEQTPLYPITVTGGYIDTNRNGIIEAGEVENSITLSSQEGNVVTIATTLAVDSNRSNLLENTFGISQDTIATQTPSENRDIEALSNTIYAYTIENNLSSPSDISVEELDALVNDYQTNLQTYTTDDRTPAEHEQTVIDGLSTLVTLDDSNAYILQNRYEEQLQANEQIVAQFQLATSDVNLTESILSNLTDITQGTVDEVTETTQSIVSDITNTTQSTGLETTFTDSSLTEEN